MVLGNARGLVHKASGPHTTIGVYVDGSCPTASCHISVCCSESTMIRTESALLWTTEACDQLTRCIMKLLLALHSKPPIYNCMFVLRFVYKQGSQS